MRVKSVLAALILSFLFASVPMSAFGQSDVGERCRVEADSSIGIVLLIDQSSSLKNQAEMLPSIGEAIRKVGSRLQLAAQDDGIDVQLGVVTFGEVAKVVRPLTSYSIGDDVDDVASELSDLAGLEDFTDYIAGLDQALAMFESQDDLSCRILLWFTDGFFDFPPEDNDSAAIKQQDADLLTDAVCGDGDLASRLRSRSIQTFAVLLKTGTSEKWEGWFRGPSRYPELHAGLSAMQAITGDVEINDLPINDYAPLAECAEEIRDSESLGGEVLVGSRQLPGVLFTLLSGAIGGDDLIKCPTAVPSGGVVTVPEGEAGLPAGVMFSRLFVTALDGEIGAINAVNFPGAPRQLFPSDDTNLVGRDQVKDLPAGWKLEISSAGSQDLAVCVQADDPRLAGGVEVPVFSSVAKVFFGDDDQIELTVDWGDAFEGADPAGVIGRWTVESEYLDVEGWADGPDGTVVVTVVSQPPDKAISTLRLVVEPQGGDRGSETGFDGTLDQPILIEDYAQAPRMECENDAGFGAERIGGTGVEVSDDLYGSPELCTVFPPLEPDDGTVDVSVEQITADGDEMDWMLVDGSGEPLPSTFSLGVGDDPVEMRFATLEPLENKNWSGSGSLSVVSTWSTKPSVTFDRAFEYSVDLKAKSNPPEALFWTFIVATVAAILSLALLRLLNFLLVKIPSSSAFYYREVPIKISSNSALGASWVPVGDGMASDSFPVKSKSDGRHLSAGRLEINRSLGPLWKPFSMPTSRLDGFSVIRSTPAARGRRSAPVAFTHLTVVGTNGQRNSDASIDSVVVVLYPRRFEFDENQVRMEVDRIIDAVADSADEINDGALIAPGNGGGSDGPSGGSIPVDTTGGGPPSRGGPSVRGGPSGGSRSDLSGSNVQPPGSRSDRDGGADRGGSRPGPPPRREPPPRRS